MVALAGSVNGLGGLYPPNGKAITAMAPDLDARALDRTS
jgi:hypothetical protein